MWQRPALDSNTDTPWKLRVRPPPRGSNSLTVKGVAEDLPFPDATFTATLASLVVGFMTDPVRGVRAMARVTAPGGTVAACLWDLHRMPALGVLWAAAAALDPAGTGELRRTGAAGELAGVLRTAELQRVREHTLDARAAYADFEDWRSPSTLGVGPIGAYCRGLDAAECASSRAECHRLLGEPDGPFTLHARCWFAAGTIAGPIATHRPDQEALPPEPTG